MCEDIAKKLGTVGYMCALNRIQVGDFNIKEAVELENLGDTIEKHIISIEKLFENTSKIELDNRKLQLFLNGVQLTHNQADGVYRIYVQNKFIGIGIVKNHLLKRDVII